MRHFLRIALGAAGLELINVTFDTVPVHVPPLVLGARSDYELCIDLKIVRSGLPQSPPDSPVTSACQPEVDLRHHPP